MLIMLNSKCSFLLLFREEILVEDSCTNMLLFYLIWMSIERHVLGPVCHGIVHYTLAIFKIEGYFHYRYNSICVRGL